MSTSNPQLPPSSPLPLRRNKRKGMFESWVRYRSWKYVVGALLIVLGVLNIYPFLWMMGTSFKTTSEAARHRGDPLPDWKYHLTAATRHDFRVKKVVGDRLGAVYAVVLPEAVTDAISDIDFIQFTFQPVEGEGERLGDAKVLFPCERMAGTPMPEPDIGPNGGRVAKLSTKNARVEMLFTTADATLQVHLMETEDGKAPPFIPDELTVTVELIRGVPMDLLMRQVQLIAELKTDHEKQTPTERENVPVRTWVKRYSAKYSASLEDANKELKQLVDLGHLKIAPPRRDYRLKQTQVSDESLDELEEREERERELIGRLIEAQSDKEAKPADKRTSNERYAKEHGISLEEAHRQLSQLVARGLLQAGESNAAYMLANPEEPFRHGLNARQMQVLRQLYDEDVKLRRGTETFTHFRLTAEEYADATGLFRTYEQTYPDLEKARSELKAISRAISDLDAGKIDSLDKVSLEERQRDVLNETIAANRTEPDMTPAAYADRFEVVERVTKKAHDTALADEELGELQDRALVATDLLLWQNYAYVLKDMKFYVKILTTLVLTAGVVSLVVMISSMLGYALARLQFPGKMFVLVLLIAGSIAPREAIIIPIFRMLQPTGAFEGLWGMVLWLSVGTIGNSLLMAGFFLTLPKAVEEAATVDGAGPFRTFLDIALPMARPIVMTVGLFAFIGAWNNFLIPFTITQAKPNMQPLAVAVYSFQQGHTGFWGWTNAAAAIMIIPVIILFLLLQKHIVKSIAVGAIKG